MIIWRKAFLFKNKFFEKNPFEKTFGFLRVLVVLLKAIFML